MEALLVFAAVLVATVSASGTYNGKYPGKCGADGFYDSDSYSFVICSNGNAYKQPCSPGSKNSGSYIQGKYYSVHPFCDVNLVDYGYTLHHGGYRNQNKGYGYGNQRRGGYGNNYAHNNDHYAYGGNAFGHGHNRNSYSGNHGYKRNSYKTKARGH